MITIKGNKYTLPAFVKAASSVIYYELLRPIAWLPSRYLFGNFIGYRNNVVPLVRHGLQKLCANGEAGRPVAAREGAQHLRENGFVMLPRTETHYTREAGKHIETIVTKCVEAFNGYEGILTRVKGAIFNIYRPLERIPELKFLITDEIDQLLRAYYRSSYRIKSVQVWRNQHIPHVDPWRDAGIANAFHNDGSPRTDLRLFVLLNNGVSRDKGALRFHDKDATRRLASLAAYWSRGWQTTGARKAMLDPKTLRYFEGNIGDSCLVNTQECLHAAGIPRLGSYRDVVQFEITPAYKEVGKDEIYDDMPEDPQVNPNTLPFRTKPAAN